jgi:hypothetical protein
MLRHDQALKEGLEEVAKVGSRVLALTTQKPVSSPEINSDSSQERNTNGNAIEYIREFPDLRGSPHDFFDHPNRFLHLVLI